MHWNYFSKGWDLDYGFARAREYGYDGIELRMPPDEGLKQALADIKALKQKHELRYVVLARGVDVIHDDESVRRKNVAAMKDALNAVYGPFGPGTIVNCSAGGIKDGSAAAQEVHFERAAAGFREIAKVAEDRFLKIVFEIHMGTIHDTAKSTVKFLDMIGSPACSANLDYGNMFLTPHAEKDIPTIAQTLKGRIGYFHLKNYHLPYQTQARFLTLLAEGDIDHSYLIKCIHESGYTGLLCPEHPWPGDGHYSALRDLAYLREITRRLGWEKKPLM